MNTPNLETLVNTLGLKTVVALLADICLRKAVETESLQGDRQGTATDWRADSQILRSIITRLKNQ